MVSDVGIQDAPIIQGRPIGSEALLQIRELMHEHPDWHRTRLSRELCSLWNWRNDALRPKDMACRSLLLKLEARGLIALPARLGPSVNALRNRCSSELPCDTTCLTAPLSHLEPLQLCLPPPGSHPARLSAQLLRRYHYLGLGNSVGENLKYLVSDRHHRPVACLLFGSAAWRCHPRDAFIGWDPKGQRSNLRFLTNNTRFLVFPWIVVPHLASHILGLVLRRLSHDWQLKYGHPIHLVETFVERDRFRGTCYRAAGWISVGFTTGRGRNSLSKAASKPIKETLLKPLHPAFRSLLCT